MWKCLILAPARSCSAFLELAHLRRRGISLHAILFVSVITSIMAFADLKSGFLSCFSTAWSPRRSVFLFVSNVMIPGFFDLLRWIWNVCPTLLSIVRRRSEGSSSGVLTVLDSRTLRSYKIPIAHNAIRAMDLRAISASGYGVNAADHGLRVFDPGFRNTAVVDSKITFVSVRFYGGHQLLLKRARLTGMSPIGTDRTARFSIVAIRSNISSSTMCSRKWHISSSGELFLRRRSERASARLSPER